MNGENETMKRFLLSALLMGIGCAACSLAAAQTMTFHADGAFAQASFLINNTEVKLAVFLGTDTSGAPSTFLTYNSFAENPDGSATSTSGFGVIPNEAFVAHSLQHFTLNVDTSQINGFSASTCIFPPPTFTLTCTDGSPVGPIQVDWLENGITTSKGFQHLSSTSGSFTELMDLNQDQSSATATGSYLGSRFTDSGLAIVGKSHQSSITTTRN